jgi:murein DD-endopeptidase MepM/ murein hydrolase activator NlpD
MGSTDVRAWPWLVGGGALAYAWTRRARDHGASSTRAPSASPDVATSAPAAELSGRWVWPVPSWNGRAPAISNGFHTLPNGQHHDGVDLMYTRTASDAALKAGSPNGSKGYVMPDGTHALAASDGTVWKATKIPTGLAVVIGHSTGLATFYAHLSELLVHQGDHVRAGQPIGIIGANPLDGEHLKHLHFEIWCGDGKQPHAIDPEPLMRPWSVVSDPSALVARNAGFTYRAIGASGEPYPNWIRALKGKAGVYVIRERNSREILYVGSSAGSLYGTVTRHFQTWRRSKQFWRGLRGQDHDPGLTYTRDAVEVAIRRTSPSNSLDEEMRLIARLRPRDNLIGQREPATDEVPF